MNEQEIKERINEEMNKHMRVYKIWAPDDSIWSQWAKPVLFTSKTTIPSGIDVKQGDRWLDKVRTNSMIILDLPGGEGVKDVLSLAQIGYRPVPLYNGVYVPDTYSPLIYTGDIVDSLYQGADKLSQYSIFKDAPPAFMLDSNRMKQANKTSGKYDNRWCVFPQDMPSASILLENGIDSVIVKSESIQNDLAHILCRYQEKKIAIYLYNGIMTRTTVPKPSRFKSMLYRYKVTLGLTRNAAGGFGGRIPDAEIYTGSGRSGRRYYGRMG